MTLPEFAKIIESQSKLDSIGSNFESCVVVHKILNPYFNTKNVEISIYPNKSSNRVCKFVVKPLGDYDLKQIHKIYDNIVTELFYTKMEIHSNIDKSNNNLIINVNKTI